MPKVVYITPDQSRVEVHVEEGASVMQGAVDNMIEGILGDCGGACACATCHCYVDPAWQEKVGTPGETESDLLEFVDKPTEASRLSCQLVVNDELDGLVVTIPEPPY
jgi:ferredoxin, 2Fe-2S